MKYLNAIKGTTVSVSLIWLALAMRFSAPQYVYDYADISLEEVMLRKVSCEYDVTVLFNHLFLSIGFISASSAAIQFSSLALGMSRTGIAAAGSR